MADVVGGEGDVAVSRLVGGGDRAVVVDRGDGPGVAVADRLAPAGDEPAVVAAGRDDIAEMGDLASGE
jgi:hypothetical protein